MIRVAAVQFATTTDVGENLSTCLRMIEEAAAYHADLVVLPEFCNRLSWYESKEEAFEFAVGENGDFLQAIGDKARQHGCYVVVNCTVKRPRERISITSFLFNRQGERILYADKQTLMGRENIFFDRADENSEIVDLPIGRVGLYMCRDGVTMETPRGLALRGAQILCNSLNSFAFDEASIHIPVRAPENRVFVISANKVGPLIPVDQLDAASEKLGVPKELLYGAGESQVIDPEGKVLAIGPRSGEAVVVAEINADLAGDKIRPDGTNVFASRRPDLYGEIGNPPTGWPDHPAAESILAATFSPRSEGGEAVLEVVSALKDAASRGVKLLVLPELFCFPNAKVGDLARAAKISENAIHTIIEALSGSDLIVCTSVVTKLVARRSPDVETYQHAGVLLSSGGVTLFQSQVHRTASHPWAALGDTFKTVDFPWGRIGILVGDDALYPEAAKVLAIRGVDVIAVPFTVKEKWELDFGLIDRSAENRVCIVAATRPATFGGSLIISQWRDFQIFTPWKQRTFTGTINDPIVHRAPAEPGICVAEIHPETAKYKTMSYETNLIEGRPWKLVSALTDLQTK